MKFVPRPMMKSHDSHENSCALPGHQPKNRSNWNSLDRRLSHRQADLLVFPPRDRLIAEYLGVMLVMHKGMSLKHALERRPVHAQEVPSVHQLSVYLVLDERHHDARENEPAANLQDKHQRSSDSAGDEDAVEGRVTASPSQQGRKGAG